MTDVIEQSSGGIDRVTEVVIEQIRPAIFSAAHSHIFNMHNFEDMEERKIGFANYYEKCGYF